MSDSGLFKSEIKKAQISLKTLFGEETFLTFREDLCEMYLKYRDESDATEYEKRAWMHMGKNGLDETRQKYLTFGTRLDLLNLSDAVLTLILGLLINYFLKSLGLSALPSIIIAFGVSLFLYSLNTGLVFAKALVSEIAYPGEQIHTRLDPTELRFRAGWNKGVIQSSAAMMGIVIYGIVTHPNSCGYDLGLHIIEWWLKHR